MTIVFDDTSVPPCAKEPEVYANETLHSPPARRDMTAREWHDFTELRAEAHRQCAGCPLMVDCLYRAVVEVDVDGFAACTTETDRARIRRELGIVVQPHMHAIGAPRSGGGPISHDAVMQMRQSHPKDTCQQLAERLGCSTSTVKRHLRRARLGQVNEAPRPAPKPAPAVDMVLECFDRLESSQIA